MNKFLYHFDKTISSSWYLALVAAVVLCYFGIGIYSSYTEKRAEAAYRAEYTALINKIDNAKTLSTIQLRGKGFFVTRRNGAIGDEAFKEGEK